jgi:hypothetical protein
MLSNNHLSWGPIGPVTLRQYIERERFLLELQALGFSEEQATTLFDITAAAATRSIVVSSEFVSRALPRLVDMATRGDTYEQVLEWANAL